MLHAALLMAWQSPTQDVHLLATTLEQAVVQLGQIFKSPMSVGTSLKDKVILIDAAKVTEQEVRDRIAQVLNATWSRKDNRWFLSKEEAQKREDAAKQYSYRLQNLTKLIEARTKAPESTGSMNSTTAQQIRSRLENEQKQRMTKGGFSLTNSTSSNYGTPNQRFLTRILQKVGAQQLARVEPGKRAVFASIPNQMQYPLGINLDDESSKASSEQQVWAQSRPQSSSDGSIAKGMVFVTRLDGGFNSSSRVFSYNSSEAMSEAEWPEQVSNILLAVYCSTDGNYSITVKVIPRSNTGAPFTATAHTYETEEPANLQTPPTDPATKPFVLSPEATAFQKMFFGYGKQTDPIASQLVDQFARTSERDPLSYGLSEAMIYDAHRMKRNVIAALDDSQMSIQNPLFLAAWSASPLSPGVSRKVAIDDSWIVVRNDPFAEPNIPRKAIQRAIQDSRTTGFFELASQASLAGLRPRSESRPSTIQMPQAYVKRTESMIQNEDDALKCYAYLSQSEFGQAMSPRGIAYGQLNGTMQNHLFACLYFNFMPRFSVFKAVPGQGLPFYAFSEPTLMAPNGISPNARFYVTVTKQNLIKDESTSNTKFGTMDARTWGMIKYNSEHPQEYNKNFPTIEKNRPLSRVTQTTYQFNLEVNDSCTWSASAADSKPIPGSSFTIDNMPPDIKAEFEAGYNQSSQVISKPRVTIGEKGQQKNPPPR